MIPFLTLTSFTSFFGSCLLESSLLLSFLFWIFLMRWICVLIYMQILSKKYNTHFIFVFRCFFVHSHYVVQSVVIISHSSTEVFYHINRCFQCLVLYWLYQFFKLWMYYVKNDLLSNVFDSFGFYWVEIHDNFSNFTSCELFFWLSVFHCSHINSCILIYSVYSVPHYFIFLGTWNTVNQFVNVEEGYTYVVLCILSNHPISRFIVNTLGHVV